MKANIFSTMYFLLAFAGLVISGNLSAQNRLRIENLTISEGGTETLSISLDNEDGVISGQLDLVLPSCISIEGEAELSERASGTHFITTTRLANGAMRVFFYSPSNDFVKGNSGELIRVNLKAKLYSKGDYSITLKNALFASMTEEYEFDAMTVDAAVTDEIYPEYIEFLQSDTTVLANSDFSLRYRIYPENAACKDVTWYIDERVSLNEDGTFHALYGSVAHIVVETNRGKKRDTCIVWIKPELSFISKRYVFEKTRYNSTGKIIGRISGREGSGRNVQIYEREIKCVSSNEDVVKATNCLANYSLGTKIDAFLDVNLKLVTPGVSTMYLYSGEFLQDSCTVSIWPEEEVKNVRLEIEPFKLNPGEEIDVPVYVKNGTNCKDAMFNIVLPEGIELLEKTVADNIKDDYNIAFNTVNYIYISSKNSSAYLATESRSPIMNVRLKGKEDLKPGIHTISITGVKLSSTSCDDFMASVFVGNLSEAESIPEFNGIVNENVANFINTELSSNNVITSLDLSKTRAVGDTVSLVSANPNMLVYINDWENIANDINKVIAGKCDSLSLTDNCPFRNANKFTAENAVFTRNLRNVWQVLELPFESEIPSGVVVEEIEKMEGNKVCFRIVDKIVPNKPYLVKGNGETAFLSQKVSVPVTPSDIQDGILKGTYSNIVKSNLQRGFVLTEDGELKKCDAVSSVKPFNGYFATDSLADNFTLVHYDGSTTNVAVEVNKGDVNTDGRIDNQDVYAVINMVLNKNTSGNRENGDMNGDGNVDNQDVYMIINKVLGK